MFKFAPREYRWRNNHFKPANDFIIFTYHSPAVYEISEALSRIFIRFYPRRVSKRKWRGATLPEESLRNDARLELRAQLWMFRFNGGQWRITENSQNSTPLLKKICRFGPKLRVVGAFLIKISFRTLGNDAVVETLSAFVSVSPVDFGRRSCHVARRNSNFSFARPWII